MKLLLFVNKGDVFPWRVWIETYLQLSYIVYEEKRMWTITKTKIPYNRRFTRLFSIKNTNSYKLRRVCIIKKMLNPESNYAETCNVLADNKLEFTSSSDRRGSPHSKLQKCAQSVKLACHVFLRRGRWMFSLRLPPFYYSWEWVKVITASISSNMPFIYPWLF